MKHSPFRSTRKSLLFVLCLAAFLPGQAPAQVRSTKTITGKWQGKLPNPDGTVPGSETPPAIELWIAQDGQRLSGHVTFYMVSDQGTGPSVQGKDEADMIDPRFDGSELTFS